MSEIELVDFLPKAKSPKKCFVVDSSNDLYDLLSEEDLRISIDELRKLFWREAGVERTPKGMQAALKSIQTNFDSSSKHPLLALVHYQSTDNCNYFNEPTRKKLNLMLDLNHRLLTSSLTLHACLFREESRGGHFRNDYPEIDENWECSLVVYEDQGEIAVERREIVQEDEAVIEPENQPGTSSVV